MQRKNQLTLAIRAAAVAGALGVAGQASAINFTAGDYDVAVYGYARLNASYDIDEDASSSTRSFDYQAINVGDDEDDEVTGHFGADAFQSRIGVKATSPEGVMVNVEGDFRGSGGGELRLRHAYGAYKNFLAGQTWSNYTSFVGNTSVLDFDSLPGIAGYQARTAQVRYTNGPFSFSVEDPKNSIAGKDVKAKNGMPALTARLEDSSDGLSYSAAILVQQLSYDNGDADDSAFGFATFVAGKMAVTDMLTIQGTLSYSDGANSYLYRAQYDDGTKVKSIDSAYVANGDLETISGYGGSIGAGINLGNGRSINIGYGMVEVDLDDAVDDNALAATTTESVSALMANYQWKPVKNVMMGIELQYGQREAQNGDDGDASRLLFAAQYNF